MRWFACCSAFACLALAACERSLRPVEYGDDDGGECLVENEDESSRCSPAIPYWPRRAVDILFVIDNSGSMGEEQGRLTASIHALIEPLEARGVDYRVAVTTTDNSNPWCGETTSPERGALVLGSCRGRLEHFIFTGTNGQLPIDDIACTDHCALEPEQLDDLIRPSATVFDTKPTQRPWIESGPRGTNLPDKVSGVEALRCVLPQGIDGCGFESQLESMHAAVQRMQTPGDAAFDFIREEAVLAIVVLTDEADCSYAPEWESIFSAQGNRVFWSDPSAQYPTSAVCWNAGVACSGGPGEYDECHAVDFDIDGKPATVPADAVMRPLSRYHGLLQELRQQKQLYHAHNDVLLAVIAGVPEGYMEGELDGLYADTPDPVVQGDFGIGAGCTKVDPFMWAVPPVRMREVEEAIGEPHLSSVCADDYSPALGRLADDILGHLREPCYRDCVADVDPDAPGLQADCFVEQRIDDGPATLVPPCAIQDGAFVLPASDDDVCFGLVTDPAAMSDECRDEGWNLQIEIVRRPGGLPTPGLSVSARCQTSTQLAQDCPALVD